MALTIHDCLIGIEKRAERVDGEKLTETFVDAAPLLASVANRDNQIIFGRRGTGKTHLLKYLDDQSRTRGDTSIYLDLRSVGSNGSIYNDRERTHAQRATPLLLDVLQVLHDNLVQVAIERAEECDLSQTGPKLDYGCYVDLITSSRAPAGLLPADTDSAVEYVDVPPDDYRSIRRAILNLALFQRAQKIEIADRQI